VSNIFKFIKGLVTDVTKPAYRKYAVVAVTVAGDAIALGLLPNSVCKWIAVGISAAGAVGVKAVPNAPLT
jgi:hypothetical protein